METEENHDRSTYTITHIRSPEKVRIPRVLATKIPVKDFWLQCVSPKNPLFIKFRAKKLKKSTQLAVRSIFMPLTFLI